MNITKFVDNSIKELSKMSANDQREAIKEFLKKIIDKYERTIETGCERQDGKIEIEEENIIEIILERINHIW